MMEVNHLWIKADLPPFLTNATYFTLQKSQATPPRKYVTKGISFNTNKQYKDWSRVLQPNTYKICTIFTKSITEGHNYN